MGQHPLTCFTSGINTRLSPKNGALETYGGCWSVWQNVTAGLESMRLTSTYLTIGTTKIEAGRGTASTLSAQFC